jgi:hypothetical protein
MNVSIGYDAKRFIETSGMNNCFAAAARQVRHRAAARLAERRCEASSMGQVETRDRRLSAKPSKGRAFHNHFARMGGPGRLPATRAMAVQEVIEGSIDFERNLATEAASLKRCHFRHLIWISTPSKRKAPEGFSGALSKHQSRLTISSGRRP